MTPLDSPPSKTPYVVQESGTYLQGCSGNFGFGGTLLEAWVPTPGALAPPRTAKGRAGSGCGRGSPPPALGVRGYYPRKIFEILSAKYCDLVHLLCCKCQIIVRDKTALVRVTHAWHIDTDMQSCKHRSRALERSGKQSGAGQKVRWAEQSGSRKKRAERGAGGRGTGAKRWAGWICRSCR